MYRSSAEHLFTAASDAPGLLNTYALPAVFLFRHYVELALKGIIVTAQQLNDRSATFPDGHSLLALWQELRTLIEAASLLTGRKEIELFDTVGEMIRELHANDPGSMSFRYPVDRQKNGRRDLLPSSFEYFDMRVFRDQADRLAHFLDGCSDHLEAALDTRREFEDWREER